MKILIIFGTRPEAIKMAPLYHKLNDDKEFNVSLCITGQHKEMLYTVLKLFNINPDYDLKIMSSSQDIQDVITLAISNLKNIINDLAPDLILVHGDTATTMAASMAGFLSNTRVGHVEAGLRTSNIKSPFPEEFNRRVTSLASDIHFAPTLLSKKNLLKEGIKESNIFITGNTVIDSMFWIIAKINDDKVKRNKIFKKLNTLLKFNVTDQKYILITAHRRESFGEGFISICTALNELALKYPNINFVYPVHLNPNVQNPVNNLLSNVSNISLIPPLDYESFILLLQNCHIILTDSGGIQEEAPSLGKPVLVLRDTTERPEAIDAGVVKLVGTKIESIVGSVSNLLDSKNLYDKMAKSSNPYGDGTSSYQIAQAIKEKYL